jgi:hypothetical protein
MAHKKGSDEEVMAAIMEHGVVGAAKLFGSSERSVHSRRRNYEAKYGVIVPTKPYVQSPSVIYPSRLPLDVRNGVVLVGSDSHYWPGVISTAHRALVYFTKLMKPKALVKNGDVFDGASISRHPPLGWESKPSTKGELEAVEDRLSELVEAAKPEKPSDDKTELIWTIGNHCARFEMYLASRAPAMEGVPGFSLRDRFPLWKMAMSVWVNDDVVIKHRFKGGVHATHNNTVNSGRSMVTGHLHSLKVTPFSDYNGTRYGVDTGTLADPYGGHAAYTEDAPLNHRSGFAVLTFKDGQLLWPELVAVVDEDHVQFRGEVIKV